MRIAIIDLGTNTFNLLIVESEENEDYEIIFKDKIPVKLGEGGLDRGRITNEAIHRGLDALRHHKTTIAEYDVDQVYAFATSAIRSAKNGMIFYIAAVKLTGTEVFVISGKKEAEFIYLGVRQALTIGDQPSLIVDIGGGSTEFIIATDERILWSGSYQLGVSRLLEIYKPSDPIGEDQINEIIQHVDKELVEVFEQAQKHQVNCLIGSSGSFDTLAEMIWHKFHEPERFKDANEYSFNMDEYKEIHSWLLKSTLNQRLNTPGLVPMRADMIVLSSILTDHIIKKANIQSMRLSTYALKEGVIWTLLHCQ